VSFLWLWSVRRSGGCGTGTTGTTAACSLPGLWDDRRSVACSPAGERKVYRASAPGSSCSFIRPLRRRMALVCNCEMRDSVTPNTSPISLSVSPS
jgi:hypothetical protein